MSRSRAAPVAATLLAALALAWAPCNAGEYGDIAFERKAQGGTDDVPRAVFPHWLHRMQYKCAACHDDVFKMKAGADDVTMDMIQSGQSCGLCHNDKTAFGSNFDTCPRCHYR